MAFGHPKGLFPLFFIEMWERLAFYTMVAVLLLYTTDRESGGLGLPAAEGNEIYGLYLAFVYFTPFLGGIIADRILGYRRAVAVGGVVMALGLLLMGIPGFTFFVCGLIGLIVGNGLFKPNISVMVGNLYAPGDPKRDTGFNIFYMGINIGAASATLILAPMMRNFFGWLWAFRAAGIGVLVAVLLLFVFWRLLERADRQPERNPEDTSMGEIFVKILLPAFGVGLLGYFLAREYLPPTIPLRPAVCGFLAGMIPVIIFFVRLGLKARPSEKPGLLALLPIYVAGGAFFMILHLNGSAMTQWARDSTDREATGGVATALTTVLPGTRQEGLPLYYVNAAEDVPRPHPESLLRIDAVSDARMFGQQRMDEAAVSRIEALPEVEVLEVGEGTPAELRARATKVYADGVVRVEETTGAHGEPVVSVSLPDGAVAERSVVFVRRAGGREVPVYLVDGETYSKIFDGYRQQFGHDPTFLAPGDFLPVLSPETYQTWNPVFVVLLTPLVVAFFQWRASRGKVVPTARKLLWGMLLTTGSLLLMALAGMASDGGTLKVSGLWLAGFYFVVTLGELCLSPMGLSLVTKVTPKRLVGLAMGGWFLASAFGNNLSGFFGGIQHLMRPTTFFLVLAGLAALVALFIFLVLPRLDRAIRQYGA